MKTLKFLIVVTVTLLFVSGLALMAVAEETGKDMTKADDEVKVEEASGTESVEETAKAGETVKEKTGATETAESSEEAEKVGDEGMVEEKATEEAATSETTEVTESMEKEVKTEEKAEATGEAKEGTAEGTEVTEKEESTKAGETKTDETVESEEVTEKAEEEAKVEEGAAATGAVESGGATAEAEAKPEGKTVATEKAEEEARAEEPKTKSLKEELEIMAVGVDGIMARLGKMQESADRKEKAELPAGLSDLMDKIVSLGNQSDVVREKNEAFIERGKAHFDAWGQDLAGLENQSLRRKGEKRRKRQLETFKEFQDTMAELEKTSVSFRTNLEEIADYLKFDLRPESVDEISSDINKIKRTGKDIAELIEKALKDLKSLPVFEEID